MTDEQFKTWAKSFLERTDTYSSWRGAAVEAIQMLEDERAKRKEAAQQLMSLAQEGLSIFDQKEAETQVVFKECIKLEKELEVERAKTTKLKDAIKYALDEGALNDTWEFALQEALAVNQAQRKG